MSATIATSIERISKRTTGYRFWWQIFFTKPFFFFSLACAACDHLSALLWQREAGDRLRLKAVSVLPSPSSTVSLTRNPRARRVHNPRYPLGRPIVERFN